MRMLQIHSWYKNQGPASLPFPTVEALLKRLEPAVDLTNKALARLVLRLRARCPASFPLRAETDAATLIAWLAQAGAVVGVSPPHGVLGTVSVEPLRVTAAANPSAASPVPQAFNDPANSA